MVTFTKAHIEQDSDVDHLHNDWHHHENPSSYELREFPVENFRSMKVIVIGAGFSGIYCGIRIPQRLKNVQLTIYEKNEGVGGTWWENRYPGCACDIPDKIFGSENCMYCLISLIAHSYQYSFAPNPHWSKFYAPAREIRAYLEGVVEKFSVNRFIKCSHKVVACNWYEDTGKWKVSVENLMTREILVDEADVVISARGTLNAMSWPKLEGFSDLAIPVMHSAAWDDEYNFENRRIGIIGGGSSAIQIIPELQKVTGSHLKCFVRSKTWIPRPFGDSAVGKLGLDSVEFTQEQKQRFLDDEDYYLQFRSVIEKESHPVHSLTLKGSPIQEFVRNNFTDMMKVRLSKKPEILDSLLPGFSVGCRRLTPGPGYLEALVEDNVDFINIPIRKCLPNGIELSDGTQIELDVLVCATGFQASAPPPFEVEGRHGQTMAQKFHPYPQTYLSMVSDGFLNYFMMLGPNAAIDIGSLTMMMEMEGDYIVKCIRKMQKENIRCMDVKPQMAKDFSQIVESYFKRTVYLDNCNSWYKSGGSTGDRITGLWPGSSLHAMETFRSPRWEDFDYVYECENAGHAVNRLAWLGNGWSSAQVDEKGGDLAFYLRPEIVDIPTAPLPEQSRIYQLRPFSY